MRSYTWRELGRVSRIKSCWNAPTGLAFAETARRVRHGISPTVPKRSFPQHSRSVRARFSKCACLTARTPLWQRSASLSEIPQAAANQKLSFPLSVASMTRTPMALVVRSSHRGPTPRLLLAKPSYRLVLPDRRERPAFWNGNALPLFSLSFGSALPNPLPCMDLVTNRPGDA